MKRKVEYKVGDFVEKNAHRRRTGKIVHIVEEFGSTFYGIQYTEHIGVGHSCRGHGKDGYCWYEDEDGIILLEKASKQLELF